MRKDKREKFINLIYNDHKNDVEGLTTLIGDAEEAITKMIFLRDSYGVVSEEAIMHTKARFEAMVKAWLLIKRELDK